MKDVELEIGTQGRSSHLVIYKCRKVPKYEKKIVRLPSSHFISLHVQCPLLMKSTAEQAHLWWAHDV